MNASSLVRLRILFYTLWALGNTWVAGMTDVIWGSLRWEQQSCVVASILMSWAGMMVAFYDKSVWKADEEKRAANGGQNQTKI